MTEQRKFSKWPGPCIAYRLDWSDGEFYVGSTMYKKLITRVKKHKGHAKEGRVGKHLVKMRTLGVDSFTWTELGTRMVESRVEQGKYEEEFRELLQPSLNTIRAYLSPEQRKANNKAWREENKEYLRDKNKIYMADPEHIEKAKQASKDWYRNPENKECIQKIRDRYRAKRQTIEGKAKTKAYNDKPSTKARNSALKKKIREEIVAKKLYACEPCKLYAGSSYDLKKHLNRKIHFDRLRKIKMESSPDFRGYVCDCHERVYETFRKLTQHEHYMKGQP